MKVFIIVALFAAAVYAEPEAEAEADPALLYRTLGYSGGYPYNAGLGYRTLGYNGYRTLGYNGYRTLGYNGYRTLGYGGRVFKREAEAEAQPEAEADPALIYQNHFGYNAYPYNTVAHSAAVYPSVYSTPYTTAAYPYAHHVAAPIVNTVAHHVAAPAAYPAVAGGYAAAGRYVANSAGVVHIAKREAEAEADPALIYQNHFGAYPYATGYASNYRTAYPYASNYRTAYPYASAYGSAYRTAYPYGRFF